MNQVEPTEVQSRGQCEGPVAALACLASTAYVSIIGAPAVDWLHVWWAAWMVYLVIPLALTFTLLHGSHIHREMSETVRDLFLVFVSVEIFAGMIFFVTGVLVLASIFKDIGRVGP